MILYWFGPAMAAAAFVSIWVGHVGVRKIEASSPILWVPMLITAMAGVAIEILSLASQSQVISGIFGIVGTTLVWDVVELRRQEGRVRRGHAPANPRNPRHALILVHSPASTSENPLQADLLKRATFSQTTANSDEGFKEIR